MRTIPLEDMEHEVLAQWLGYTGLLWFHTPNGGHRHMSVAKKLKRQGVKSGVPDFLIPLLQPSSRPGAAIELKRIKGPRGGSKSKVSPEQRQWLHWLSLCGWETHLAYGADDAIAWIESRTWFKNARGLDLTRLLPEDLR